MSEPEDENDAIYAEWLREKRGRRAPERFSENVMDALPAAKISRGEWLGLLAKVALLVLAAVVGIGRFGVLLFCLLLS